MVKEDEGDEFDENLDEEDEELEDIVEDDALSNIPVFPRVSELIIPSLERSRIIERSLEGGVREVEVEGDDSHSQYGVQDDYVANKNYSSIGDKAYDSVSANRTNIEGNREVSLPIGSLPTDRSDNISQGSGFGKREGKTYQSSLEQGSDREEERKRRERRMM